MPKFRLLTESEAAITQQWLQGLKAELERVVPGKSGRTATTSDYLQWLELVQYEGISLGPQQGESIYDIPCLASHR